MLINVGLHHFHLRHRPDHTQEGRTHLIHFMDSLVYVGGFAGILVTIPQLGQVWINQKVEGLSLITWTGFLIGTLFWLAYGIVHKAKPIIYTNIAYTLINLMIVIGILTFKK